jgi:hypothetical protein
MGHQRLGDIPKTQKWQNVVAKVAGDDLGARVPPFSQMPSRR